MNESELQILVTAVDNASATLQGVADKLGETKKAADNASDSFRLTGDVWGTASKLMLGAATAAGGAIMAFAYDALKGFGDSQVAAAKLEQTIKNLDGQVVTTTETHNVHVQVLKNTGEAADKIKKQIDDANFSIQQKTKQLDILNSTHDKTAAAHAKTQIQIENVNHDIDNLKDKIVSYQNELTKTVDKVEKVTSSHSQSVKGLTDWQNKVADAEKAGIRLGFTDEQTDSALNKLIIHTKDLSLATTLNTTAMDLARSKNIDLETAANLVGLAFEGQGRILLQYGIHIKDTASGLDAVKELQSQIAGQSSAFAMTLPGQMAVMNAAWQSLKDIIGSALFDALEPLITQFTDWLLNPDTKKSFEDWSINLKIWGDVLIPVIIEVFKEWASWLTNVFNLLTQIGNAINAVIAAFKNWPANLGKAGQLVAGIETSIGAYIGNKFAEGGIVTRPTLAMVGEGGESEAIIPLSKMGSLTPSVTVNVNGGYYLDERAARDFGQLIVYQLQRVSRVGL